MDKEKLHITRGDAARAGQRRYLGQPCFKGHSGERYTLSGACVQCSLDAAAARRKEIRELIAAAR